MAPTRRTLLKGVIMNISRRSAIKSAASAAALLVLGGCGGSGAPEAADDGSYTLVTEGKLTAVADMYFPPFEYMDDEGNPIGYEIDLVGAIATELGLEIEWLPSTKFDTIITLIKQGGKADIGASAFTITDERKEEIDFTDPIVDSNQGIVVRIDDERAAEADFDTPETKVACQSGTTGEAWILENLPNATCVPLDEPIQAMTGVSTGLYDACVTDLPVESWLCEESYSDLKVAVEIPTGEQYGIVVSKDNPNLTAAINDALAALKDNGTFDEIQIKYFGAPL